MTAYGAPPATPAPAKAAQPLFDLIGAGLGVVSFILGFLSFYGYDGGGGSTKGFAADSSALALSLLAAAVAAAVLLSEKTTPLRPPYAAAAAAAGLLVAIGNVIAKGDGVSVKIGLWLLLVVLLAQTVLFALSWLQANGKIMVPRQAQPASHWGPPSQQYPGYGQQQPGGYGPPSTYGQPPQPGGYGQPPQPPQPLQPQPGGYGQPPQPPQQPSSSSFGPPTTHQSGYLPQQPQQNPNQPQQPPTFGS